MSTGASVIGGMNIVLGADGASFSQSIDRAQQQLNKLKGIATVVGATSRAGFTQAGNAAERFGHSSVTSVQAASGALRELNGDLTNNIRAVERFITTIPGVGNALKALYPVVGTIAIAGMFYEGIKKAQEYIDTVNKIPDALKLGFRELVTSAQMGNDELRLTNDRLQNEIDKLAGKPQNNLAVAIDETRLASDRLNKSIAQSTKAIAELLKQNSIGLAATMFLNKDRTDGLAGSIDSFESQRSEAMFNSNQALRQGNSGDANRYKAQYDELTEKERAYAAKDLATRTQTFRGFKGRVVPYSEIHGDQSAALNIDRGVIDMIDAQSDAESEGSKNAKLTAQKEKDEAAIALKKKSAADTNRANEVLYRSMQELLAKQKETYPVSIRVEFQYWQDRIAAFKDGSAQYADIVEKMSALAVESAKQTDEKIKAFKKDQLRSSVEDAAGQLAASNAIAAAQRQANVAMEHHSNSLAELNAVLAESADRLKEQYIGFDLASGSITRHDAAVRLATLHLSQYQAELVKLDQEANNDAVNSSLTPDERQQRQDQRNQRRAGVISGAALSSAADQYAIDGTTPLGAATDALEQFIAATRDSAAQIKNFTDQSLGALNDQIVKSLTTRDHSNEREFRNVGANIFRSAAGTGLNKLEGMGLSALGLGSGKKPTGAAGDPLHVVMEGGSDMFGGLGSAATSMLFGGGSGGAASVLKALASGAGPVDTIGSTLTDMIPFLAEGGPLSAGTMAVVGERGPELFMPGASGTVIPNHKLGSFGGGGGAMTIHVDARGAHDPAAVRMQVNQAIRAAAPHIAAMGAAAQRERQLRLPSTRR